MAVFQLLRHRFLKCFVLLAIAFQVMNMSIDPIDSHSGAQDIAINEIESCIELVLEVFMEKQNAIEETDETDESTDQNSTNTSFTCFSLVCQAIEFKGPWTQKSSDNVSKTIPSFFSPPLPVNSPPPKFI
jgi:hypothetical protein